MIEMLQKSFFSPQLIIIYPFAYCWEMLQKALSTQDASLGNALEIII